MNVPAGVPSIGGDRLGSLDFLFVYDGANFASTGGAGGFAAAWVEIHFVHAYDIGIEYGFTHASKSFQVIGTSQVNALN